MRLRTLSALTGSAILSIVSQASAATLYWDGTSASWNTVGNWSTESSATTPDPLVVPGLLDDLIFNITTVNGAQSITLDANQFARSITFNNTDTTTLLGGGSARTLMLGAGGITIGASAGAVTLGDGTAANDVLLSLTSGAQTWTNNSAANFTINNSTASFTRAAGATLSFTQMGAGTFNINTTSLPNDATGIIGNWATFGSGANTRYAYNNGGTIQGYIGTAAATAANVTSTLGTFNYDVAGGNATLGAGANINTLRYTGAGGTISGALTTNGIMNVGGGGLALSGALTSGNGELVINAPNGSITFTSTSSVNNNGNLLVVDGSGTVTIKDAAISGSGGLTKNGSGFLEIGGQNIPGTMKAHTYTGTTTINGGVVRVNADYSLGALGTLGSGNLTLNGGVLEYYFAGSFTRTLGTGVGQVQILGGASGFGSGNAVTFTLNNNANFEAVWGGLNEAGNVLATGLFNPSTFVLNAATSAGSTTFANKVDLNGSTRTVQVNAATGIMSGIIRTSSGTAGLTKTGAGILSLSATNTYNGPTTINGGILDVTIFAAGGSNSSIGNTSVAASNLVLDGGTLRHSAANVATTNRLFSVGTSGGGIDSSSASATNILSFTGTGAMDFNGQLGTRTLTLGGSNTGNNTMALLIGNDGSNNATSLTKTGAGLWILSNASNSYTGPTTLTAGTLSIGVAGNLGAAASNLVFNGGTLQITGTGITSLSSLGRTVVFNSGATVGLDVNDAGNVFTVDQVLNQGIGGLTKAGAGTLVLNQANTYTGVTTISAGTLQLNSGGSIAGSIINNSIYLVNQNATTGTALLANIAGSGSIAAGPSATITINTPTGLQFNALNTTGGGSFALSGVTTPTLGGLVGTTGNLSSSFSSGYSSVTNLTLNTAANNIAGNSFAYGGVINDGATGMSLTKTGAGTQTLTGNNTYTGTTFLNGGTLAVGSGSTIGKLSGTTDINFNGGTLQFNRSGTTDIDAINNAATITVNSSSTFGVTSADAGNANANETIGAVTLNAGQMNFNWTNGGSSGNQMILTSLSRSGTASANFNSGFATNSSRWKVTGAGTTTAGQIIGPWYTTGGNNAGFASTDYAVYSSDFIAQAAIAGSAETTWTNAANAYTTSAGGTVTLTGTRTITALRNTGATTVLTLASGANLETYGLLNGVGTLLTVAPGTGGVLTTPTGGGNLYVNAGAGAITITAAINNNSGNVTLVKNGSNTLTLTSTTSNFSGGVVLNAGTLVFDSALNIGGTNNSGGSAATLTVNGNSTIATVSNTANANLGTGTISLNNGAILTFSGNSRGIHTVGGAVSGSGGVTFTTGTFHGKLFLNSTANTFTGAITSSASTQDVANVTVFSLNSIADGVGYGNIILNGIVNTGVDYGSGGTNGTGGGGAIAPLVLNNRQIILANNNGVLFNNSSNQAVTINTDIGFSGTGARSIQFGFNTRAGSGINTFNGKLMDNVGGAFAPTFSGGTWVVTNSNTYSGTTTVSAGTLQIGSNSVGSVGAITSSAIGTGGLTLSGGALSSNNTTARTILNAVSFTGNATLGNATNTGKLTFSANAALGGATRTLTLNSDAEFAGVVSSTGAFGITKAGTGILSLSNTNTYTGVTTISAGVLEASVLANGGSNSSIGASANTATNLSLGNGTTFRYVGSSDVLTDRGFQINGTAAGHGAIIESSGNGTLSFNNTVAINWGTNNQTRTLTLGGANTGNNTLGKVIANNGSGATSLVKSGAGKWVLDQTNTYTGATSVNQGILAVNGTGSINSSAVTVNGGDFRYNSSVNYTGTFTHTAGTISGTNWNGSLNNQTISTGEFISPGNSPGTASTGGQTWAAGGTYVWEINNVTGTAGADPGWDLINGTGTLNITASAGTTFIIDITSLTLANIDGNAVNFDQMLSYAWLIADFASVTNFDATDFTVDASGFTNPYTGTFGISQGGGVVPGDASQIYVTYTAIPEPKAALLGCLGILLLLRRRR